MDRFVIFLLGVYGKSVPTYMNTLFDSMSKLHPSVDYFIIPTENTKYCHIMTEFNGDILAPWLLGIKCDIGVELIFVFDRFNKSLYLHKGYGSLQNIMDIHYVCLEKEYEKTFNTTFDFVHLGDSRIRPYVVECN